MRVTLCGKYVSHDLEGSSQSASGATLDSAAIDALIDLLGGESDALAEVVNACLEELPARIAEIHAGIATADAVLTGRAAHTLKSNALTVGALNLARLSAEIEAAARAGDLSAVGAPAAALDGEWATTRPLLVALRDNDVA